MMRLFDSHCHLQDRAFAGDAFEAIARAEAVGLAGMLVCGYDPAANRAALDLAASSGLVHAAVGFHPHDAKDIGHADLDLLRQQAGRDDVVAVGELGLDFYRDLSARDVQREVLEAQLAVALEVGKPVSVHSRSAEDAILEHLAPFARAWAGDGPPGVMHCFGGTFEQARPYLDLGFLVSISCAITYPANHEARRLARETPLAQLVAETDSPYLPPQPRRGQRNEPSFVAAAVEVIAAERGIAAEEVAGATTSNAFRTFAIRLPAAAR